MLSIGVSTGLPALSQLGGRVPKGYVRLLVFDADSNLVSSQGRVQQLSSAAQTGYEPLTVQVIVQQDGYVTAYVGNESNTDVYFDDVTIEHRQGLQVQENQYDPWGLGLAGLNYRSPGLRPLNQYQFNAVEGQGELGLGLTTTLFRLYDPQLGRFHQVDPLADFFTGYSPFVFGYDNPLLYSDADGLGPILDAWRKAKDVVMGVLGRERNGPWHRPGYPSQSQARYEPKGGNRSNSGDKEEPDPRPKAVAAIRPLHIEADVPVNTVTDNTPDIIGPQYRGRPLTKSTSTSFQEDIKFKGGDTDFKNKSDAVQQLVELVKTLQDYPQLQVVIIANGATEKSSTQDGHTLSKAELQATTRFKGVNKGITIGGLLMGRAQSIVDILRDNGISGDRIKAQTGGVYNTEDKRKATIQLTNP